MSSPSPFPAEPPVLSPRPLLPEWVVLHGGTSSEREVSLGSGRNVAAALEETGPVRLVDLTEERLPDFLDPRRHVVFPALHGRYGEDGGLQRDCEARGIAYAGCDPVCSELCMWKDRTKQVVAAAGLPVIPGKRFTGVEAPEWGQLESALGSDLVLKPEAEGSSVGLHAVNSREAWETLRTGLEANVAYLVERRIRGREFGVGCIPEAAGVVEIIPSEGALYDLHHKYTAGTTRYLAPAHLSDEETVQLRSLAAAIFSCVGARDFARIDFLQDTDGTFYFLEVNTLPGMTSLSILPRSASVFGFSFSQLVHHLSLPAVARFKRSYP